ncbi:hypothetical protein QTP88_016532 [Uroleucon formosanum]
MSINPMKNNMHECIIINEGKRPCDPTGNQHNDSRVDWVKWATGYDGVGNRALHRKYVSGRNQRIHKYNPTMIKLCSWNVRGLNRPGKLPILEDTIKNIAVTGVSETHWKTTGHFTTTNVLGYNTFNDRMMSVKLQATPVNTNIVQVYAPTSIASEEEMHHFYEQLTEVVRNIPTKELLFVSGDLNAKIDTTNNDGHLRSVVGKYGIGVRNERGDRLMDFCIENNLFITNTNFKHHIRRLYTWQSPCGQYRNQIDYILVRNRWKSSVRDTKTYPGMVCGSEHNALVAEICLKLKKAKN